MSKIVSKNSTTRLLNNLSNNLDNTGRMLNRPWLFFEARERFLKTGVFADVDQLELKCKLFHLIAW